MGGSDTVDCSESGMRVRAPVRAEAVAMTTGGGTEVRRRAKGGDSGGRAPHPSEPVALPGPAAHQDDRRPGQRRPAAAARPGSAGGYRTVPRRSPPTGCPHLAASLSRAAAGSRCPASAAVSRVAAREGVILGCRDEFPRKRDRTERRTPAPPTVERDPPFGWPGRIDGCVPPVVCHRVEGAGDHRGSKAR
ncbi:hypothetical protein GCM10010330_24380 [Streptomyces tendae]|nr:hypothetical protein GCM10010330_24380 [Streptomyces tendae]